MAGQLVTGTGVTANSVIELQTSGSPPGGTGIYQLSQSSLVSTGTTITTSSISSPLTSSTWLNLNLSGSPAQDANNNMGPFTIYLNDATTPGDKSRFTGEAFEMFEEAGWDGTKYASYSACDALGIPTAGFHDTCVGHVSDGKGKSNMSGPTDPTTDPAYNQYNGTITGANDDGYLTAAATGLENLSGNTMFIQAETGSFFARKHELQLFEDQLDDVSGRFADSAILFGTLDHTATGTVGWASLMTCGDYAYTCPVNPNGTVFAFTVPTIGPSAGMSPPFQYGMDMTA